MMSLIEVFDNFATFLQIVYFQVVKNSFFFAKK